MKEGSYLKIVNIFVDSSSVRTTQSQSSAAYHYLMLMWVGPDAVCCCYTCILSSSAFVTLSVILAIYILVPNSENIQSIHLYAITHMFIYALHISWNGSMVNNEYSMLALLIFMPRNNNQNTLHDGRMAQIRCKWIG